MRTIAISIDDATLDALAAITRSVKRVRGRRRAPSRSEVVRLALRDYLERQRRAEREARDRQALARHRQLLARQAAALVAEQAEP